MSIKTYIASMLTTINFQEYFNTFSIKIAEELLQSTRIIFLKRFGIECTFKSIILHVHHVRFSLHLKEEKKNRILL